MTALSLVVLQITTVPTAQHPSIVRTAKAEKRLKEKMQREVIHSIQLLLFKKKITKFFNFLDLFLTSGLFLL